MNQHLTSEQIATLVVGDASREETQHGRDCPECGREIDELREVLGLFRSSVRYSSERNRGCQDDEVFSPTKALRPIPIPRWTVATAAVMILAAIPFYRSVQDQRLAARRAEDSLLLVDIGARLSHKVPVAMEPLMQLLSNDNTVNSDETIRESGGLR